MQFRPKEIKDKSGRTVILRNAEVEDSEALIEYLKVTTGETPFLIREPEEVTITLKQEQNFIKSKIDDPRELLRRQIIKQQRKQRVCCVPIICL